MLNTNIDTNPTQIQSYGPYIETEIKTLNCFASVSLLALPQSCKKTFFIRTLDFQLRNVRILYLLNFAIVLCIKLNKCLI